MASPILHIKDGFYFEVPKGLKPVHLTDKSDFTGSYETWLRLDPQFQEWEAHRFYDEYANLRSSPPSKEVLIKEYLHWKHDHNNEGKPFWKFISVEADHDWFVQRSENSLFPYQWRDAIEKSSGSDALVAFRSDSSPQWKWSTEKLEAYSRQLSGKILIPQPFGRLANLYEKEWGFCVSKFMMIEVAVAILLWAAFSWLARNVRLGDRPRGPLWNLLEVFVVFIRDEIARPVIGHQPSAAPTLAHAESAQADHHGHESHTVARHESGHDAGHDEKHGTPEHPESDDQHHDPRFDADRFVPLLLTIFFFVLGCNLAGMLPWVGSPTGEWGTTAAVAIVTFVTGIVFGMLRFGVVGYFLNQIPKMDLPLVMAVAIKPMIFAIELLGVCIKHAVLSIRLLANMLAGHMVLVSLMALAFSIEGASSAWFPLVATASVLGSTAFSCLELFVALLQAYIFTLLSAMFIGAAVHQH